MVSPELERSDLLKVFRAVRWRIGSTACGLSREINALSSNLQRSRKYLY